MLLREEQTFLSLILRTGASGSYCEIARKPDEKRMSVKDSDSDEEAADAPIRPIPGSRSDTNFKSQSGYHCTDSRRNQAVPDG
jgi:hypothetical protein